MYDKTVRRRRAVLLALVALSLILLTVYFREPAGGGLHSVQRGFLTVLSPIENGASKALKPVRDMFGWVGDTIHASSQRDQLRKRVDQLQQQVVLNAGAARELASLQALLGLDSQLSLKQYAPVTATVILRSPTLWYSTIGLDKGSNAGIRLDDPVINGEGLVGKVTNVTSDAAIVTLLTDQSSGVSALVNKTGYTGIVQPAIGNPNDLVMTNVPLNATVHVGDQIVTSGTLSSRLDDLFPPEIPIGTVTSIDSQDVFKSVHLAPFANLRNLDVVQVLRRGTRGARSGALVAATQLQRQGGGSGAAGSTQTASTGGP